jgi:hypothetical protein
MAASGEDRKTPAYHASVWYQCKLKIMPSDEELQAEIARLRAENEALKKPAARGQMSLKVSEKGALSVYGLGRFPVTLYREQWEKLLGMSEQIRQFIKDNDHQLKKKE